MSNAILAKMAVEISANNAKFGAAMAKSQKDLSRFTSTIKGVTGTLAGFFGVREVVNFHVQIAKIAGTVDGVRGAFDRLPESTKLMQQLKEATGNTVSEIDLMKRAVQASNFDISLKALPQLLEFAAARAQQTGESVDYLVNSIVTGIGRKSPLILDNLGISSIELKKRLGDVSIAAADVGTVARVVGDIAGEAISKNGKLAQTTAVGFQQLAASWENFKATLGSSMQEGGLVQQSLKFLADSLEFINKSLVNKQVSWIEAISKGAISVKEMGSTWAGIGIQETLRLLNELRSGKREAVLSGDFDRITQLNTVIQKGTEHLRKLQSGIVAADTSLGGMNDTAKEGVASISQLVAEWDRANSIFSKKFSAKDQIKDITGPQFEFDSGALVEMANAPARALDHLNESLKKHNETFLESNEIWIAGWRARMQIADEAAIKEGIALDKLREKYMMQAEAAQTMGASIGGALSALATKQQNFAQAMASITSDIITMYLRQSIAAMIAATMRDPTTPLPIAKIAMAAAGIAAVTTMFNKIGQGAGSPTGASNATRMTTGEVGQSRSYVRGYTIETVLEKDSYRRSRVG